MDSAQHCLDQAAECLRLSKAAKSDGEARSFPKVGRDWPVKSTDTMRSSVSWGASSRSKAASVGGLIIARKEIRGHHDDPPHDDQRGHRSSGYFSFLFCGVGTHSTPQLAAS